MIPLGGGLFCTIVYSIDDNGYYGEIFDKEGKAVVDTKMCPTKLEAIHEAKRVVSEVAITV